MNVNKCKWEVFWKVRFVNYASIFFKERCTDYCTLPGLVGSLSVPSVGIGEPIARFRKLSYSSACSPPPRGDLAVLTSSIRVISGMGWAWDLRSRSGLLSWPRMGGNCLLLRVWVDMVNSPRDGLAGPADGRLGNGPY